MSFERNLGRYLVEKEDAKTSKAFTSLVKRHFGCVQLPSCGKVDVAAAGAARSYDILCSVRIRERGWRPWPAVVRPCAPLPAFPLSTAQITRRGISFDFACDSRAVSGFRATLLAQDSASAPLV